MTDTAHLKKGVLSVFELLSENCLEIPVYQRPYKWTEKNINQLFSDIALHKYKTAYRLGTVVFHREEDDQCPKNVKLNIVDGQQRTLSLMLAARALINERTGPKATNPIVRKDLQKMLGQLDQGMKDPCFSNRLSQTNLHKNYLAVSRIVSRPDFTEEMVHFLLNQCELVYFELKDISEAFQFFDSQNARGRDLEPHDLLKAFHLREFTEEDEHLKSKVVSHWESSDSERLAKLFSNYLFRIRNWSRGESARYFGKEHTHLFKGVNINSTDSYPYVEQLRMAHHFVDNYNLHYQRRIDGQYLPFPFHLDQIIINGRRFFEMIGHYHQEIDKLQRTFYPGKGSTLISDHQIAPDLEELASRILRVLSTYEGRWRTGDRYVRSLFDCLLIAYVDKFGMVEISRAIEKVFIWAYSLRLKMQVVQLASMDNHALANNLFLLLKEATQPADFLSLELPVLEEVKARKTDDIERLFKEMRFYESKK